jgi:hypothetical protein
MPPPPMSFEVLLEGLDFGRAPYGLDAADELTVARSILAVGRALPLNPLPPTLTALRPSSLRYEVRTKTLMVFPVALLPAGCIGYTSTLPPKMQQPVPPLREHDDSGILSLEWWWAGGEGGG